MEAHEEETATALTSRRPLPAPPVELREHAGRMPDSRDDPEETYERLGKVICDHLVAALPETWSFEGKRVLDFGCGAGRVLRHLIPESGRAELWGCDIHRPSIEWLERNLSPPLNVFVNAEHPPLPHPSGTFDLIVATSVFTHLVETWSAWLVELHRLLGEDGLLAVTFKNRGSFGGPARAAWHEDWDEDQIGMHVYAAGLGWEKGGPAVYQSQWWLRAHWGRAFEFQHLEPESIGQGIAVMRKRPGHFEPEDLEALEPGEPREIAGLRYSLRHARRESAFRLEQVQGVSERLRHRNDQLARTRAALERSRSELRREKEARERAERRARGLMARLSGRLTRQLRALAARLARCGLRIARRRPGRLS